MITTFFINIATALFSGLLGVLPTSSLPDEVIQALQTVATSVNAFSFLIPVGSIFSVVLFVLTFEAIWFAFWGFIWLWKRLPFVGK